MHLPLLLALSCCLGQPDITPRPFLSAMFERHAPEFYAVQADMWGQLADEGCGDEAAWVYAYKYAQYANREGGRTYDLDSILVSAKSRGLRDDSFALNFLRAANTRDFTERAAHLKRAFRDRPGHHATYTGLTAHYEVTGQDSLRDDMLQRINAAKPIPPAVMDYNYNQLNSVEHNAILLTYGDADTFPSWLLQAVYGQRTDVRVINWSLLAYADGYRETVSKELGLALPVATDERALLDALKRTGRPVYVGLGRDTAELPPDVADKLKVTGLAMRYGDSVRDNIAFLRNVYERVWRLERLRAPLADDMYQRVADRLNGNYLVALDALRTDSADAEQSQAVEELMKALEARAIGS